jgi:hypothetical protein
LVSEPWWYARTTEAHAVPGRSDETELGLQVLLEQLQLAELREIAHQRGWTVRGSAKADYVATLASAMEDPTEIARAVASLPEDLREALRAALVTEDGSGITPASLAQTVTALRSTQKPPLKPVEAAGLLTDLAHWGLLIPWRDAPRSTLHYLFPWEVQRHIPPLPGWCRQVSHAPRAAMPAKDPSAFVQLLHSIWERIAHKPLRLRPSQQSLLEEGTAAALRGWRYDQLEVQDLKRPEVALRALSVPLPEFLVDDAGMETLLPLANGDAEQLEFVCRLLCELDLVSTEKGYLLARPEVMTRFLRSSCAEQEAVVAQAYISLLNWNELDVLLRRDTRLVVQRAARHFLSYREFRSQIVRLRHLLLRFLATAGEQGWCPLEDVEPALRMLWPDFAAGLQSDGQPWGMIGWWLTWRQDSHDLRSDDSQLWQAAQGGLLRIMLEGPLHWLGFADLCRHGDTLLAFRLRGLANRVWDRPLETATDLPPSEAIVIDGASLTISVHPAAISPQAHALLGRIARLEKSAPGRFTYRLDMLVAHATFERGETLAGLRSAWQETMPQPMPEHIQQALAAWWHRYGQVRLYDGFALLELGDDVTLRELEASTSLPKHIIAKLSPRLVLVPDEAVDDLLREFSARGLMPKEAR